MNLPLIANPQLWAKQNQYTLVASDAPQGYLVRLRGNLLGFLKPVGKDFQFIGGTAPQEFQASHSASTPESEFEPFVSRSFGLADVLPFSLETQPKNTNELELGAQVSGTGQSERVMDCNYWLPYAAEHYNISRDIRDYVLVPIPALFSDLPNTNGDSLSLGQMLRFDPNMGMQMYKTFKGKPTHYEHDNKDITKAKGVILDAFLRPVHFNSKYYKITMLLAFDRTKDPELCRQILSGESNAYSVGFYYSSYTCSICNNRVGKGINLNTCIHTQMGRPTYRQSDGRLAFRRCEDGIGFECSAVNSPAFVSAIGPYVMDARM